MNIATDCIIVHAKSTNTISTFDPLIVYGILFMYYIFYTFNMHLFYVFNQYVTPYYIVIASRQETTHFGLSQLNTLTGKDLFQIN